MEDFLSFEFSSEPVSLFKLGQMRLSENKAKLEDCLRKKIQHIDDVEGIPSYIMMVVTYCTNSYCLPIQNIARDTPVLC